MYISHKIKIIDNEIDAEKESFYCQMCYYPNLLREDFYTLQWLYR